jgi:hypothetical protein
VTFLSNRLMGGPARRKGTGAAVLGLLLCSFAGASAHAADVFRQIKGDEIRARFSGKQLTDGIHWAMHFNKGGRLATSEQGGALTPEERHEGGHLTWRVIKNELCIDSGNGPRCHEVWVAGRTAQLRRAGEVSVNGVLE